ncbi:MAG: hypothetical protein JJT75_04550 [Opitutales bacterium]|nr:hypothetical protein [Opitutales bacterium]MCH8541350.1 hypothetical protein [Opitutales bacterium]
MNSWILTVSYLWKDTWKRWLEQPGSVLARSVVTLIMVGLATVLLVGFRMQVENVREQIESFGLRNIIIEERMGPEVVERGAPTDRFRDLQQWGDLLSGRVLSHVARSDQGRRARIVSYTDADIPGLLSYLQFGHPVFVLSSDLPEGLVVDYQTGDMSITAVALRMEERHGLVFSEDVLFVPSHRARALERRGFSMVYFFERAPNAPPLDKLSASLRVLAQAEEARQVEVRSSDHLLERLREMEEQQNLLRLWLGGILGGALALIYGVLSILEFRQSLYVSALLRSFGVSSFFLGIRTIFENAFIANGVALVVISLLQWQHENLFAALRVDTAADLQELYWGTETMWIFVAVNVGILLSSLPVFVALRRPVGEILE